MPKLVSRLACATLLFVVALASGWALATAQRTFIASNGSDLAVCSIAQPCRSLGRAITQTNPSGEIIVLDSAGYGPVTITQPVSIIAPAGVYAGISVFTGNDGVIVNAPGSVVVLRGLTINGQGGDTGINIVAAQEVHVESTIVANMGLSGIFINTAASLLIKDSSFRDNSGSGIAVYAGSVTAENVKSERNGGHGLYIQGGFASVGASFLNQNFNTGIRAEGGQLIVHSTMIAGNGFDGVFNNSAIVTLEDCSINENGAHGVRAQGNFTFIASTTISRSHIMRNGRTSPGNGTYSSSDYGDISLANSTLVGNSNWDVEYTFCCTLTYQNNVIGFATGTGGNLLSATQF